MQTAVNWREIHQVMSSWDLQRETMCKVMYVCVHVINKTAHRSYFLYTKTSVWLLPLLSLSTMFLNVLTTNMCLHVMKIKQTEI